MRTILANLLVCRTLLSISVVFAAPMDRLNGGDSFSGLPTQQPERTDWYHGFSHGGTASQGLTGIIPSVANDHPAGVSQQGFTPLSYSSMRQPMPDSLGVHNVLLYPSTPPDAALLASPRSEKDFSLLFPGTEQGSRYHLGWGAHAPFPQAHDPAESSVASASHATGTSASLPPVATQQDRKEQFHPEGSFNDRYYISWGNTPVINPRSFPKLEPKRIHDLPFEKAMPRLSSKQGISEVKDEEVRALINRAAFDGELTWVELEDVPNRKRKLTEKSPFKVGHRVLSGSILEPQAVRGMQIRMVEHQRNDRLKDTILENKPHYSFWGIPPNQPGKHAMYTFYGFAYVDPAKVKKNYGDTPKDFLYWVENLARIRHG